MIRLGVDFDNTLITYDSLFKKTALERDLIPIDFPENKTLIRNYLCRNNKAELFTLLQGEIYGSKIFEACQADGMFDVLRDAQNNDVELFIVSHKTKKPYLGPKYDLHKSAVNWLQKNRFFDKSGINMPRKNVYFEDTKENKIKRIETLGCSYFIDDLPEILNMISSKIKKILYKPLDKKSIKNNFICMDHWSELKKILS